MSDEFDDDEEESPSNGKPRVQVANFVREWRRFRHMTQEELAARAEVSRLSINQIENGHIQFTQRLLVRLAPVLRCRVSDLIGINPLDPHPVEELHRMAALMVEFNERP